MRKNASPGFASRARLALSGGVEDEGADLDALTRTRIHRRRRVGERGVRHKARRNVGLRVGDLQQQRLVAPHLRYVVPLVRWVVFHRIGFTDAVTVNQVRRHEIVGSDGAGIADRERRILQWGEQRAPQVDDLHAALQQFLRLVWQQVANPLRAGISRMVDMHPGGRLARSAGRAVLYSGNAAALQVVEDEDATGGGHLLDDPLGFGVIDSANLVVVPEILYGTALFNERETLRVERHVR